MSVKVRPYRRGGWEVDILLRLPNGTRRRERCKVPVTSKPAAYRWGEDRERHLLQHGPPLRPKEVPTLEQFALRFLDGHARANRQKPSGINAKESIIRAHLIPLLGSKKLDAITTEQVQTVKRKLTERAPKTVNNVLTVLNVLLKKAVEWDVVERMPCTIRLPLAEVHVAPFERDHLAAPQSRFATQQHDEVGVRVLRLRRRHQRFVLIEVVEARRGLREARARQRAERRTTSLRPADSATGDRATGPSAPARIARPVPA